MFTGELKLARIMFIVMALFVFPACEVVDDSEESYKSANGKGEQASDNDQNGKVQIGYNFNVFTSTLPPCAKDSCDIKVEMKLNHSSTSSPFHTPNGNYPVLTNTRPASDGKQKHCDYTKTGNDKECQALFRENYSMSLKGYVDYNQRPSNEDLLTITFYKATKGTLNFQSIGSFSSTFINLHTSQPESVDIAGSGVPSGNDSYYEYNIDCAFNATTLQMACSN